MVKCGKCTSKTCLGLIGLLFWIAAAALMSISIYVFVTFKNFNEFTDSKYVLGPAGVLLAIGIFFFIAGVIGFCNICKDNRCLLCTFGFILFLLVVLLISAAALVFVYKAEIEIAVENNTMRMYREYGGNDTKTQTSEIDYTQKNLQCCGVYNYTDWETLPWGKEHLKKVPPSCCKKENCNTSIPPLPINDEYYEDGCYTKVKDLFIGNLKYIAGAAIGLVVILIVGFICTCVLMCYRREEETPYYSLSH